MKPPIFVVYENALDLKPLLEQRFPNLAFHYVNEPEMLRPDLETLQPEIVFSIKGPGFSADHHRPIGTFPSVRWIHVGGSGYDHLIPWDRDRITMTNCAGVLARHLAETVIGAMLALNGNFLRYVKQQQDAIWKPHSFKPLSQQTLLIVGLGAIGEIVADYAKTLGMTVLAIRRRGHPHASADHMYKPEELKLAVGKADFVSIHVRLNRETERLFDREILASMKPTACLLNTSRGPVVDQQSLIELLQGGHLKGAYLDVFEQEPLPLDSPLWSMPNVLITPHAADDVFGWPATFGELFCKNLDRWLADQPLINVVSGIEV